MSNMPVSIEQHVDWVAGCLRHLPSEHDVARIRPAAEAEDGWVAHHDEITART